MENKLKKWVNEFNYRLMIFNLFIVFLFILRSAGYFQPYFPLSVNFIVLISLVLAVVVLSATSRVIFIISIFFWVFAAFLQIVHLDVWAERTGIYAFESLLLGVIVLVVEEITEKTKIVSVIRKYTKAFKRFNF